MILVLFIILGIVGIAFLCIAAESDYRNVGVYAGIGIISLVLSLVLLIHGCANGFINYPPTEGTHQGVITAVDLERSFF